jgi:transposase
MAEKLAIIRECLEPGASLAGVALAHRANANMVRKWVVKYQRGGYDRFADGGIPMLPVVVTPGAVAESSTRKRQRRSIPTVSIEVALRRGVLRVPSIDATLLRVLIEALSTA